MRISSIFVLVSTIVVVAVRPMPASADEAQPTEETTSSKVQDHLSKFQKYFRVHSSREHKAAKEAEEKFERMQEEKKVAGAKKRTVTAAQENDSSQNQNNTIEANSAVSNKSAKSPASTSMQ